MKPFIFYLLPLFCFSQKNLTEYVNPFIGTGGHGHTFPGAVLPFGMVQASPDTRNDGSWDGCSGYHYTDSIIYGFSHTHLSGTGCSDWGDVMLMPAFKDDPEPGKKYYSSFHHKNETARAGYYQVLLNRNGIKVELTATLRTGIHRYTFPGEGMKTVLLDLLHRDKLLNGKLQVRDSCTITGMRESEAWARDQKIFFAIRFSSPIKNIKQIKDQENDKGAVFYFPEKTKTLLIKVGISSVSADGALANLNTEAPHWDFDLYRKNADEAWNKQLNKIAVNDPDRDKLSIFYTSLYHCFIHPSIASDADGTYRARDGSIRRLTNGNYYSVFSLWDTYRALHPLFNIIDKERSRDFVNTLLLQYQYGGRLPVWELSGNETDCMIGYHSVSVITDAIIKGITDIDSNKALIAMKAAGTYSGFGISTNAEKGYLDVENESESVSRTLEYAYDDWCIAQLALKLNERQIYTNYIRRAQSYKNAFDLSTGFMRPRKNGNWLEPFDPREVNNHFTEGNSWQYSFYVPQDVNGLIALHGGKKNFESKLDSLFQTTTRTTGREQADITGLIGQYAHGNEPSHHMAYLYNYVEAPHKSAEIIRKITKEFYRNAPDGLIGNDDCGQMSAWYVFSALGFYPVCPGSAEYILGTPCVNSAEIHLENGKTFLINQNALSAESKIIRSIKFDDKLSNESFINHDVIMRGGSMTFLFDSKLSSENEFGKGRNAPRSQITTNPIICAPVIKHGGKSFRDKTTISILSNSEHPAATYYTTNGEEPTMHSFAYKKAFTVDRSCTIKAKSYYANDSSSTVVSTLIKKPNNWSIQLMSKYNTQYSAGGSEGVIDGIHGSENWRKGEWQGYQYRDFECILDLKSVKQINSYSMWFLQDSRSWILFPKKVELYTSENGKDFLLQNEYEIAQDPKNETVKIMKAEKTLDKTLKSRYIKLIARNFGKLPDWHLGHGDGAFIFIDEVEVK